MDNLGRTLSARSPVETNINRLRKWSNLTPAGTFHSAIVGQWNFSSGLVVDGLPMPELAVGNRYNNLFPVPIAPADRQSNFLVLVVYNPALTASTVQVGFKGHLYAEDEQDYTELAEFTIPPQSIGEVNVALNELTYGYLNTEFELVSSPVTLGVIGVYLGW